MKFEPLLQSVGNEALFETGLLLAGSIAPNDVQRANGQPANTSLV